MAAEEFDIQKKYERKKEEERQREKGIVEDKKRVVQIIKLYAPAGAATAGPPIGPILGQHQLNTALFCKDFNALTAKMDPSYTVPVFVVKRADKTFEIVLRNIATQSYLKSEFSFLQIKTINIGYGISYLNTFSIIVKKFIDFKKQQRFRYFDIKKAMKLVYGTMYSCKIRIY
jgi:large subunit ribosomal protein L11